MSKAQDADALRRLRISNPGIGNLLVDLDLSGLKAPFGFTGSTSFRVRHGGAKSLTITFAPTEPGSFSATIGIASSDPNNPSAAVPVSGVAIA